jgi:acyl-CoA thioesterase
MSQAHLLWIKKYIQETYQTHILENFLDLKVVELSEGKITYSTKIADRHSNFYGFVHGGTLASISDIAMGMSCVTLGKRVVTIDMSISYIKNAPTGSILTAVGQVISNGKTIMRAAGEIYHGEQMLIRSQASYFVTGEFTQNDFPSPKTI